MTQRLLLEIESLKKQILGLGAIVEERVHNAVKAVSESNLLLARGVLEGDTEVDSIEVDIEEECLKLLALHQPVALDLRFIIAVLKINNDLERIGDLAVNIAHRVAPLSGLPEVRAPFDFQEMSSRVKTMLRNALLALVNRDAKLAGEVLSSDDEVDTIHRGVYAEICRRLKGEPDNAELLITLLSVSRNLERIADHATNIAEDVIYLLEGDIVRHGRGGRPQ